MPSFIRSAKIAPPPATTEMPAWQRWLTPGTLVRTLSQSVLITNTHFGTAAPVEGKETLVTTNSKWFKPGDRAVRVWDTDIGIYIGEHSRVKTPDAWNKKKIVLTINHLFLFPTGSFIVDPAFLAEAYPESEENTQFGV